MIDIIPKKEKGRSKILFGKLIELTQHAYYKNYFNKFTAPEKEFIVNFIYDNSEIDSKEFTTLTQMIFITSHKDIPKIRKKSEYGIQEILSIVAKP